MLLDGFVLFIEATITTLLVLALPVVVLGLFYDKIKEMLNDN